MRRAEPLAGLGGIALLVSLFLPWYGGPVAIFRTRGSGGTVSDTALGAWHLTGWQAFGVIDVLLAILAVLAILVPISSVATSGPAKAIGSAVIASATGWLAILLVAFRLLDSPGPNSVVELRYGAWIALAGAIGAWVGSWLSMRDESTPGAIAPEIPRRAIPT